MVAIGSRLVYGSAALSNIHTMSPALSIVIPCHNEADNLTELLNEIADAFHDQDYEVVIINDGSTDHIEQIVHDYRKNNPHVMIRLIHHVKACGQSAALQTGIWHAKGQYIATIDGDGQNNPVYIYDLWKKLQAHEPQAGLAAGQRTQRKDTGIKQYASRFANSLRCYVLKDQTRDSGCGLKVMRRDVFLQLPFFDGWHRYLPALVMREGFDVVHLDVIDRPRQHGVSKYGIVDRGLVGLLDLWGVWWLCRRRKHVPEIES